MKNHKALKYFPVASSNFAGKKTSLQSRHPTFHTYASADATLSNLGENLLFIISMKAKNEFYFGAENKEALMMPEEGEIWS